MFTGISNESAPQIVSFTLGDMMFEYDEIKNQKNITKHGISFTTAAAGKKVRKEQTVLLYLRSFFRILLKYSDT